MRHRFGSLILVMLFAMALTAPRSASADGEVAGRMTLLAKSLTTDYNVKRPGSSKVPLAIFDFACPESLQKQRVGFAVAELLKSKFIDAPEFALLERSDLDKILKEQALQQTGAVDENTAVQLGKVVGAKLAISGSVDKLGGNYQVSARLSDVATGEVLAVAVQELPAKLFEVEAGSYLNLVPEEQAIGIFACLGLVAGSSFRATSVQVDPAPVTYGVTNPGYKPAFVGFGVRYQPARMIMVEARMTPLSSMSYRQVFKTGLSSPDPTVSYPGGGKSRGELGGTEFVLNGLWVKPLTRSLRAVLGAGVDLFDLDKHLNEDQLSGPTFEVGTGQTTRLHMVIRKPLFIRPVLEAGVEWKPQPRFGLSIRGLIYPVPAKADVGIEEPTNDAGTRALDATIGTYTLPPVAGFFSLALYF